MPGRARRAGLFPGQGCTAVRWWRAAPVPAEDLPRLRRTPAQPPTAQGLQESSLPQGRPAGAKVLKEE